MKKDDIRRSIKAQKCMLTEQEKTGAAEQAFKRLEQTMAFIMSDNILLYHSLPDELSTLEFIDRWHTRKHFFLPRVNGVNLDILPYEKSKLHLGAFNIEEPDGADLANIADIELIIVPAIAYDANGNRVGRGKGYYDRLLAETKATKIGVGYDFQIVDSIDAEAHDIAVDMVITDRRSITVKHHKE
jgi:5-formyltetrahydrofolate cyclo-ligase